MWKECRLQYQHSVWCRAQYFYFPYFAVSKTVLVVFQLEGLKEELACLPAVHEASWDSLGS